MKASMDLLKSELISMAEDMGLDVSDNMNKAELVDIINSASSQDESEEASPKSENQPLPSGDQNEDLKNHPKFAKYKSKGDNQP